VPGTPGSGAWRGYVCIRGQRERHGSALEFNAANSGDSFDPSITANGYGGGLYAAGGTVTICNDTVESAGAFCAVISFPSGPRCLHRGCAGALW
jgi:hypothetical protein